MRRPTRRCVALLGLAAGLAACRDDGSPSAAAQAPLQGAVLVLLDTLRADHCSAYGYARPTTPALEGLARRGALFENAISSAPWTLPAVAALLSGDRVPRALDGERAVLRHSLVEVLHRAGIETAAFTEGGFVSRDFVFDRGFDLWHEEEGNVRRTAPGQVLREGVGSVERTFAEARRWLGERRDARFFLLIHSYEPHVPYTRHRFTEGLSPGRIGAEVSIELVRALTRGALRLEPFELRYLEALYDGDIRAADDELRYLLEQLESQGLADRTLVVVTSDHGEDLGDLYPARAASHGHSLHDPLVRVPLVIADPAEPRPGRRVAQQVRLVDVLPTVAARLGAPHAREIEGRDLGPLLRGEEAEPRLAFGGSTRYGPPREFVRSVGHKYIERTGEDPQAALDPEPPARQLFDLSADPREQHDIAAARPDLADSLARRLAEQRRNDPPAAGAPAPEALPRLRERLRALGYAD